MSPFPKETYGLWSLSVQGGISAYSDPREALDRLDGYNKFEVALFNGDKKFLKPSRIQNSLRNLDNKFRDNGIGKFITKDELNRIRIVLFTNTDKSEITIPDWKTRGLPITLIASIKVNEK
jgi:hypothetical protein